MDEAKREARFAVRRALEDLSSDKLRKSDSSITRRVMESTPYQNAKRLFCYYSTDSEPSTRELIADAAARGKTVALPVSGPDGHMEFYRYDGALRPGQFGIMEPDGRELLVPEAGDLLLVPGVAFDRCGFRLGRGGGYYDRYLAAHPGVTMGLCWCQMLIGQVPHTHYDVPVDYIVTEAEMINCMKKSGVSEETPHS